MSTENKISTSSISFLLHLLQDWEKHKSTVAKDRDIDFEKNRLETIEKIAQAFVDYHNQNTNSKPYSLILSRSLSNSPWDPR